MSNRKTSKTRIDRHLKKRLQNELGDTSENDFLKGAIIDLIEGDLDAEYYDALAELHAARGERAELDGRIDNIDDRIEELKTEREQLVEEREATEERIENIEDELEDVETNDTTPDGGRSSVDDVAYDLLVELAHGEIGSNGITGGYPAVSDAATRAGCTSNELIDEMREMVDGETSQSDKLISRGLKRTDDDMQNRMGIDEFESHRRFIANGVLDEEDVDWDRIPDSPY